MSSSGGYNTSDHNSRFASSPTVHMNAGIIISAVLILVLAIIIVVSLQFYARWMWGSSSYWRRNGMRWGDARNRSIDPAIMSQVDAGLEKRIVDALPTFVYSSEKMMVAMECAVCISEFEENETGRMLPTCSHCFHSACIDMWLRTHATCPLCRLQVGDGNESNAAQALVESLRLEEEVGVQAASSALQQFHLTDTNATVEQSNTPNISNISEEQRRSSGRDFHTQQHHQDSSSDAPVTEKMKLNMQYPVNTLFYGDQSIHVSNRVERFQKAEHLVIDIPSREAGFYPACNSGRTPHSSATAVASSQQSKSPLSHLSAIKQLLFSMRERRSPPTLSSVHTQEPSIGSSSNAHANLEFPHANDWPLFAFHVAILLSLGEIDRWRKCGALNLYISNRSNRDFSTENALNNDHSYILTGKQYIQFANCIVYIHSLWKGAFVGNFSRSLLDAKPYLARARTCATSAPSSRCLA